MSSLNRGAALLGTALALALVLAAWAPAWAEGAAGVNLTLPPAQTEGGMPLMQALKQRRTAREFSPQALEPQILSNLLWAAFGINRPESGRRMAPSAKNWQEVDVYVVLPQAAYRYDAKAQALVWVAGGDLRPLAGRQGFVNSAPLNLVFVVDLARTDIDGNEEKVLGAAADVGFVSQNVYLYCASAGLNTVVRAGMDQEGLCKALGLRPEQPPTLAQTVGHPPTK